MVMYSMWISMHVEVHMVDSAWMPRLSRHAACSLQLGNDLGLLLNVACGL